MNPEMPDTYLPFVFGYLSLWLVLFAGLGYLVFKVRALDKRGR